jgi:hypothetical protein
MSMPKVVRGKGETLHPHVSEVPEHISVQGKRYIPAITIRGLFSVRFVWGTPTNSHWWAWFQARHIACCQDAKTAGSDAGIYWCVMDMKNVSRTPAPTLTYPADPAPPDLTGLDEEAKLKLYMTYIRNLLLTPPPDPRHAALWADIRSEHGGKDVP